jgi:hypothetical protein
MTISKDRIIKILEQSNILSRDKAGQYLRVLPAGITTGIKNPPHGRVFDG